MYTCKKADEYIEKNRVDSASVPTLYCMDGTGKTNVPFLHILKTHLDRLTSPPEL